MLDANSVDKKLLAKVAAEKGIKSVTSPVITLKIIKQKLEKMDEAGIEALTPDALRLAQLIATDGEGMKEEEEAAVEQKEVKPKKEDKKVASKKPIEKEEVKAKAKKANGKEVKAKLSPKEKAEKPERKTMSWKERFEAEGNPFQPESNAFYAFQVLKKHKFDAEKSEVEFAQVLEKKDITCSNPKGRLRKILSLVNKEGIV